MKPWNRRSRTARSMAAFTGTEGLVLHEPPPNSAGGRTLIIDARDPHAYKRPNEALKAAAPQDQVFVRPGIYEDKLFIADRPVWLIGAGRDLVFIFSRRGGPLYLQCVPWGRISGITFRYVGSDPHAAMNILDSSCTITHCRATEGVLSGVVIYGPNCWPAFLDNEVCGTANPECSCSPEPALAWQTIGVSIIIINHHFGLAVRDPGTRPDFVRNLCRDNMLSSVLLFHHAAALVLDNTCRDNQHWGLVMTPGAGRPRLVITCSLPMCWSPTRAARSS